jgi:hypothetical protein
MSNVINFERFRPGRSTLAEMYEEVTEGIFPFVTFRVMIGSDLLLQTMINWCRFRELPENPEILEVRSCDCSGMVCGHPTQKMYISKRALKEWKFVEERQGMFLLFEHVIEDLGKGAFL